MVNLLFTSLCPAKILLPCPDSNPVQCQLKYPKINQNEQDLKLYHSSAHTHNTSQLYNIPHLLDSQQQFDSQQSEGMPLYSTQSVPAGCPVEQVSSRSNHSATQRLLVQQMHQNQAAASLLNKSLQHTAQQRQHTKQARDDLHFPVLVPLWQIYVRERPLPIFLHTLFMTVAALLWPLQVVGSKMCHLLHMLACQICVQHMLMHAAALSHFMYFCICADGDGMPD